MGHDSSIIVVHTIKGNNERNKTMARRRQRVKTSLYLWYGLYAVAGYFAYNWWRGRQTPQITIIPPSTA